MSSLMNNKLVSFHQYTSNTNTLFIEPSQGGRVHIFLNNMNVWVMIRDKHLTNATQDLVYITKSSANEQY